MWRSSNFTLSPSSVTPHPVSWEPSNPLKEVNSCSLYLWSHYFSHYPEARDHRRSQSFVFTPVSRSVSCSTLSSLINRTLTYLNSSTWVSTLSLTRSRHTFFFSWEPRPKCVSDSFYSKYEPFFKNTYIYINTRSSHHYHYQIHYVLLFCFLIKERKYRNLISSGEQANQSPSTTTTSLSGLLILILLVFL